MSAEAPSGGPLWPENTGLVILDAVDSTMAEAARRAPGLVRPTWILAHRQTAARGRRGRAWQHPEGNFAATLVLRADLPLDQMALTSFQAALALYDTLVMYLDRSRLALKWPNDVLLDGRKVAGILLETGGAAQRVDWLSVGIGINIRTAPGAAEVEPGAVPPICLAEAGAQSPDGSGPPTPQELLEHLAFHMALNGRIWREAGFDTLRRLWLARAARLGETITARTARESWTGRFETVDESGHLVLRTPEGARRIAAAEIHF